MGRQRTRLKHVSILEETERERSFRAVQIFRSSVTTVGENTEGLYVNVIESETTTAKRLVVVITSKSMGN